MGMGTIWNNIATLLFCKKYNIKIHAQATNKQPQKNGTRNIQDSAELGENVTNGIVQNSKFQNKKLVYYSRRSRRKLKQDSREEMGPNVEKINSETIKR